MKGENSGVLVRRFLRQGKRRDGRPGAYTLRFLVWLDGNTSMKPRRVEVGLETNDLGEAVYAARMLLRGLMLLGAKFSGQLGELRLRDLKVRRRNFCVTGGLPLFERPPLGGVDKGETRGLT